MGDFGTPVVDPQGSIPAEMGAIKLFSGVLGLKQQKAELQQAQQTAQQRAGIANWMQHFDPEKHVGSDGTMDLNSIVSDQNLRQVAGDQYQEVLDKFIGIKEHQLKAKQSLVDLNADTRNQFLTLTGALAKNPDVMADNPAGNDMVKNVVRGFVESSPEAAEAARLFMPALEHAPKGKLSGVLQNFQKMAADASTQAAMQAKQPGFDKFGRPYTFQAQSGAFEMPGSGGNGGAASGGGGAALPGASVPNQDELQTIAASARSADQQISSTGSRDINRRILNLAKETTSGPGTEFVHKAMTAFGLPGGGSYQELGSFLDRQAASAAEGMGLPATNMGLGAAQNFTGNTQLDNKVIADKTKFVDALQAGTQAFRQGMEKALGSAKNPNYASLQDFRTKWAANFDPEVFVFENAVKSGDKEEQAKLKKELGDRGIKALVKKYDALQSLIKNGK
jgi:hypothetical protein